MSIEQRPIEQAAASADSAEAAPIGHRAQRRAARAAPANGSASATPAVSAAKARTPRARAHTPKASPAVAAPVAAPAIVPVVRADANVDLESLRARLLASVTEHNPRANVEAVDRAFDLAVKAHDGQKRVSGEPYVVHPIASAQILADLGIDPIAIQGALLHDVPEDT